MVRRVARIVAAAAFVLPLTTCVFFLSPFPGTLSQVVAKADVSSVIPASSANSYQPYVLTPLGGEFVVLMNRQTGVDPTIVVFDSTLNLVQAYTYSQIASWGWIGGSVAMVGADQNATLGSVAFSASELAQVNVNPSWTLNGTQLYAPSFSSPSAQKNEANFAFGGATPAGPTITYQQFQWWDSPADFTFTVQVDAAGNNYQVQAVYNVDDTPTAGAVVLVLADPNNQSHITFVRVPLADVWAAVPPAGSLPTLKSPLLSNYTWKSYYNVPASSIGFAGDCMVGYAEDSRSLNRYSLSSFDVIQSLPIGSSDYHLQYAYRPSGGYAVIYDPTARTLTKVANWW